MTAPVLSAPLVPAPRTVRTRPVDLVGTLLQRLPHARGVLAWVRDGSGLVGWGEAARLQVDGPDRFTVAREWWQALVGSWQVEDEVGVRGTGPVAFGSFAFSADEPSVLVVPEVVLGRMGGTTWLTRPSPAQMTSTAPSTTPSPSSTPSATAIRWPASESLLSCAAARLSASSSSSRSAPIGWRQRVIDERSNGAV